MKRPGLLLLVWMLVGLAALRAAPRECVFCHHDGSQFPLHELNYSDGARLVCEKCLRQLPACWACQLPTDRKPHRDSRILCASCLATGLSSQAQCEALYREVTRFVNGLLGRDVRPLPPVKICDKDELQTRVVEGGRAMQVDGFYSPYNPEQVYVLSYVDRLRAGATLSHEYTHAWQSRHAPEQDRALKEGFAMWVEYHYLCSVGATDRAEALRSIADPDYGASLNRLLEIERSQGRAAVIQLGTTGNRL